MNAHFSACLRERLAVIVNKPPVKLPTTRPEPIAAARPSKAPVAMPTLAKSIRHTLQNSDARVVRNVRLKADWRLRRGAAGAGRPRPSIEPGAPHRGHGSCDCCGPSHAPYG